PPERIVAVAAAADAAGLAELWVWEDCFKESGIATATAMLAATSRVRVGIGLLPVPLRNVALTAMELATVSRLFPGRLIAGVGHGVLDWMGQAGARAESPMTLLREYTAALYALLHGETVTTRGRYVNLDSVALDWPPALVPPLLVGGIRPRTVSSSSAPRKTARRRTSPPLSATTPRRGRPAWRSTRTRTTPTSSASPGS